ncbi:MAG TPA: DUF6282 family protein [Beijerinckiaceae bacterium]|jgi:hypothetical protein|nr:DUF6282 family protein [Beijerinckiaceae bacterium]
MTTTKTTTKQAHPRAAEIEKLLVGAIDLHCHSGPAAMPRILDHHDAMMDCAEAKFRALLYKDHFYLGTPHAIILEKLVPNTGVKLFSGIVLNNASGGFNPHAVDHAIKIGAKQVWMPTLSAKNHIDVLAAGTVKTFPTTAKKMLEPIPLTVFGADGKLIDEVKQILDLIAEGDVILAGGHLATAEIFAVFEEAKARGVKKMLVNHPTYKVNSINDAEIRGLAALGAVMEHSICMFVEGGSKKFEPAELKRVIDVVGPSRTVLSSDLGLKNAPRPVDGYREIVGHLLDLQFTDAEIKAMTGDNAAALLNLETKH